MAFDSHLETHMLFLCMTIDLIFLITIMYTAAQGDLVLAKQLLWIPNIYQYLYISFIYKVGILNAMFTNIPIYTYPDSFGYYLLSNNSISQMIDFNSNL